MRLFAHAMACTAGYQSGKPVSLSLSVYKLQRKHYLYPLRSDSSGVQLKTTFSMHTSFSPFCYSHS